MSEKKAKAERSMERQTAAQEAVAADPQALIKAQFALVRYDGAIEGASAGVKVLEDALTALKEAMGVTKAARRGLMEKVDAMQKEAAAAAGTVVPEAPVIPAAEAA